jgi:hypothetical protein
VSQKSHFPCRVTSVEIANEATTDTVVAVDNYWGTTQQPEIEAGIFDDNDQPLYRDDQVVQFLPFLNTPSGGAGIDL